MTGLGMTDAAGVASMKKSLVKNPLFARYFTLERCRGFRFPPSAAFSPVAPRIIGSARKTETRGVR